MIEQKGIATTVIGLVRPHLEKSQPPRSLFVPFQLGRPLGEPEDKAFQRQVLMHALNLLGRGDGPVILDVFHGQAPGWSDTPEWRPPFGFPNSVRPLPGDVSGWSEALAAELMLLTPHWERGRVLRGRTTVGISQQAPAAWPDYIATFLGGAEPFPPPRLPSAALAVRFVCDDLKAFYGEAVLSSGAMPSSRQLDRWFWTETAGGALLQELRRAGLASESNALKTVTSRFIVPAPYVLA